MGIYASCRSLHGIAASLQSVRGRAMRASVTAVLDAPIEAVWEALQTPALLLRVTRGLMRFTPESPAGFPARWELREYGARLHALGFIPVGRQIIGIEHPPRQGEMRLMRDNGRGDACERWDHLMVLTPMDDGRTRYEDVITVEAGARTPLMIALAWLYYTLRQRRLKREASQNFRSVAQERR
jgi:hypothetical protein